MPVPPGGDHPLAVLQELPVLVPLHLRLGGGVDGAGDLHLVAVPAVDEGLLLLYLWLVLNIQSDLKRISLSSPDQREESVCPTCAEDGLPHPLSAKQL